MKISGLADGSRLTVPTYPCRLLETRHCPEIYKGVCGDRPCARFESEDETPWLPELNTP